MIFDALDKIDNYLNVNNRFKKAADYLKSEINDLVLGRYEVADGIIAMVSEYKTKEIAEGFIEAHRKYIDIQIMLKGEEKIGVCNIDTCIKEPYDMQNDLQKLRGNVKFMTLKPGYFTVFFPNDGHMPQIKTGINSEYVKKLVIKVQIED